MTIIDSSSDSPSTDNPLFVTLEDTAPEPSALGGIDPPVPSTLGKSPLFRGGGLVMYLVGMITCLMQIR